MSLGAAAAGCRYEAPMPEWPFCVGAPPLGFRFASMTATLPGSSSRTPGRLASVRAQMRDPAQDHEPLEEFLRLQVAYRFLKELITAKYYDSRLEIPPLPDGVDLETWAKQHGAISSEEFMLELGL